VQAESVDRIRLLIRERSKDKYSLERLDGSIKALLKKHPDVDIVGQASDHVELLVAIRNTQADAVLLMIDTEKDEGMLSHLFAEYPDLIVLAIPVRSAGEAWHQQPSLPHAPVFIEQRCRYRYNVDDASSDAVVQALCAAVNEPLDLINHSNRSH